MASYAVYDEKARIGFRFYDLDKNGYITREEVLMSVDKLCSLSQCTEEERKDTHHQLFKWVDVLFPEGQIDEDNFVEASRKLLIDSPNDFYQACVETHKCMFHRIDADKDNFISVRELELFYQAYGYDDKQHVAEIFKELDENSDGVISEEEFTRAFATFWSNQPGWDIVFTPF